MRVIGFNIKYLTTAFSKDQTIYYRRAYPKTLWKKKTSPEYFLLSLKTKEIEVALQLRPMAEDKYYKALERDKSAREISLVDQATIVAQMIEREDREDREEQKKKVSETERKVAAVEGNLYLAKELAKTEKEREEVREATQLLQVDSKKKKLAYCIENYKKYKSSGAAKVTKGHHKAIALELKRFLAHVGDIDVEKLDAHIINDYILNELAIRKATSTDLPVKRGNQVRQLGYIKKFLEYTGKTHSINNSVLCCEVPKHNTHASRMMESESTRNKVPFECNDYKAIFNAAYNFKRQDKRSLKQRASLLAAIAIMMYTGMRTKEVCTLKVDQINMQDKTISVATLFDTCVGKTIYSSRAIEMPEVLVPLFARLIQDKKKTDYIIPCLKFDENGERGTSLSKSFTRFRDGYTGIADKDKTLYSSRHRFNTRMVLNNEPDLLTKQIMGHKPKKASDMTANYFSQFPIDRVREAMRQVTFEFEREVNWHRLFDFICDPAKSKIRLV